MGHHPGAPVINSRTGVQGHHPLVRLGGPPRRLGKEHAAQEKTPSEPKLVAVRAYLGNKQKEEGQMFKKNLARKKLGLSYKPNNQNCFCCGWSRGPYRRRAGRHDEPPRAAAPTSGPPPPRAAAAAAESPPGAWRYTRQWSAVVVRWVATCAAGDVDGGHRCGGGRGRTTEPTPEHGGWLVYRGIRLNRLRATLLLRARL